MYCTTNFKTKKALKEAVAVWNASQTANEVKKSVSPLSVGAVLLDKVHGRPAIANARPVHIFAPGLGTPVENGKDAVEGPHYPAPHTWYAVVTMKDGIVVAVK